MEWGGDASNKNLGLLPGEARAFNPSTQKTEAGSLDYIADFRPVETAL